VVSEKRAAARKARNRPNDFHLTTIAALQNAKIPFLIAGAYVVEVYAGVSRRTKDFDLCIRPQHVEPALDALARAGFRTEVTSPHWLAKAKYGRDYVDLIFRAGNGLCEVDDLWFERAHTHELAGLHVKLSAPEDAIWMKAYIMERERFDGADVAHILLRCAEKIDWHHLVQRFGPDWRVLLSHLVLFGYIYPSERERVPAPVIEELIRRLNNEAPSGGEVQLCRGTLLSRKQYLVDVHKWGFRDARLTKRVHMDSNDITQWTKAIPKEEKASDAVA
jgi:hypothetical protein